MAVLLITPSILTCDPGASQTFVASGGSGSGYVFSFLANNSGGTLNSSTGAYVAGSGGFMDLILLVDSLENSTSASVNVIGLSQFQGIGLLPNLTSIPAPVMGDAGDFLGTDGTNVFWAAVPPGLPDQTSQAGKFLTTDGATASWATVGGGGGGISGIGAVIASQPDAATITGGGTILQLGIGDNTNPGVMDPGTVPQILGGAKQFQGGAQTLIADARNPAYAGGAVSYASPPGGGPVATAATVDTSPVIEAIFAEAPFNSYFTAIKATFPDGGLYYFSRPICPPQQCSIEGNGIQTTIFCPGMGTPAQPSQVQNFVGPMIYLGTTPNTEDPELWPVFVSPLLGTGRALPLYPTISYALDDAFVWTNLIRTLSDFCIQFEITVTNLGQNSWPGPTIKPLGPPQPTCAIIGSLGPNSLGPDASYNQADSAFLIVVNNAGGSLFTFQAFLTTADQGQQSITSGTYTVGNTFNVEMDYNGSFFDFYINGVNVGHIAATGLIIRKPWEACNLGACYYSKPSSSAILAPVGVIDSIRLSNIHRHTGTGSFTPPVVKYTSDANTMALYNWDQGDSPNPVWPFILGQALTNPSAHSPSNWSNAAALVKHWMQIANTSQLGPAESDGVHLNNFQIWGAYCSGGISGFASNYCSVEEVQIFQPSTFGINWQDPGSFYNKFRNTFVYQAGSIGHLIFCLRAENINTVGCPIGTWCVSGSVVDSQDQPFNLPAITTSFIPYIFGGGNEGVNSLCRITGCDVDSENVFPEMKAAVMMLQCGSIVTMNNEFDAAGGGPGETAPCIWYHDVNFAAITHINEVFVSGQNAPSVLFNDGSPGMQQGPNGQPAGYVTVFNCTKASAPPLFNLEGWVQQFTNLGFTNVKGLSAGDLSSNNLQIDFTVKFGSPNFRVNFLIPEPDGNYRLSGFQAISNTGSTPAAGSTQVLSYTTDANGFYGVLGADPGGSCFLNYSVTLIRVAAPPLLYVQTPAIPSNYANPIAGQVGGVFAVGITVVPADNACFQYDSSASAQTVVAETGTGPATNWWEMSLVSGASFQCEGGPSYLEFFDSSVSGGKLNGLLNPGPHNIVIVSSSYPFATPINPGFRNIFPNYIDRIPSGNYDQLPNAAGAVPIGTQQANIYVGARSDSSQALTSVTHLRNLKVDTNPLKCFTAEPDYGPQTMAQAAFFGENLTIGHGASGGTGGWATQVSSSRYGTAYYWMAASGGDFLASDILAEFWIRWGTNQGALTAMTLWAGYNDLLSSLSATTIMSNLQGLLDGTTSLAYYVPPTSSTATCVINAVSFTATFATDASTTINNLITLINASGPTTAIVTPSNVNVNGIQALQLVSVGRGLSANSITVTTNGAHGAAWLGVDINGNLDVALTTMYGAVAGAIALGTPIINFANVGPFAGNTGWTSGIETQRTSLNTLISNYCTAHVADGVVLLDVNTTLWNPSAHTFINPIYDSGDGLTPNNAGHTALYVLAAPLLPGVGTAPSSLTYSTNPASYVHGGGAITPNTPTVTGTVVSYAVSPPLPAGLVISATTGHITGSPTTITASATYTVMASNTAGSTTVGLVIAIT